MGECYLEKKTIDLGSTDRSITTISALSQIFNHHMNNGNLYFWYEKK